MIDDYLWDKSGPPDPEIERLERALGGLRYKPRPLEAGADGGTGAAPILRSSTRGQRPRALFARAAAAMAAAIVLGAAVVYGVATRPVGRQLERARSSGVAGVAWDRVAKSVAALPVDCVAGAPHIDERRMEQTAKLAPGEWLETDETSRARIAIAELGLVDVAASTRVRLVTTGPSEHRLDLARGTLSARIDAPPRLFIVETPSATAVDLGCAYTLSVDEKGVGAIHVTSGWVALEAPGRSSLVPASAMCFTRPGTGPGTPFFEDAPEALRSALDKLDFEGGGAAALRTVLAHARRRDSLTLWHLLFRVDEAERRSIFTRLRAIVPPPPDVSESDAVRLDEEKLDGWRDRVITTW